MDYEYAKYAAEAAKELLAIDSPTGFTDRAAEWVQNAFTALGFDAHRTVKGGVIVDFGGEDNGNGLILMAHTDTLGGMVAEVKANGRLRIVPLGGLSPQNIETENVRVYTRDGRVIGLSKLARIANVFARRPQLQERLTAQLADFLEEKLEPQGVAVIIEAEHLCMTMRGVRAAGAKTQTSALRGRMKADPRARAEVLDLLIRG